jgi:hypothetical protein
MVPFAAGIGRTGNCQYNYFSTHGKATHRPQAYVAPAGGQDLIHLQRFMQTQSSRETRIDSSKVGVFRGSRLG